MANEGYNPQQQPAPPSYPPPAGPAAPPWQQPYAPGPGGYPSPQPMQPPRKKRTWIWVVVIGLVITLCACPVVTVGGLYALGRSFIAKTERLVASAPPDGSAVSITLKVGTSNDFTGQEQVSLRSLINPMDIYEIQLQPTYKYYIGDQPTSMDAFYLAAHAAARTKVCKLTFTRDGIQSLALEP